MDPLCISVYVDVGIHSFFSERRIKGDTLINEEEYPYEIQRHLKTLLLSVTTGTQVYFEGGTTITGVHYRRDD